MDFSAFLRFDRFVHGVNAVDETGTHVEGAETWRAHFWIGRLVP